MRFLIPEVLQTPETDSGVAALKALLDGYGISTSLAGLREACRTESKVTSIEGLETAAVSLGLNAEQVMLPVDHLLLPEARTLPALLLTVLPDETVHFVTLWSIHGPWLQLMDPTQGRRWVKSQDYLDKQPLPRFPVSAAAWRDWAGSEDFLLPLGRRLEMLGVGEGAVASLVATAVANPSWHGLAALDAATRMATALVRGQGLAPGLAAEDLIRRLSSHPKPARVIAWHYWFARPEPGQLGEDEQVLLRGPLLVRTRGMQAGQGDHAPYLNRVENLDCNQVPAEVRAWI